MKQDNEKLILEATDVDIALRLAAEKFGVSIEELEANIITERVGILQKLFGGKRQPKFEVRKIKKIAVEEVKEVDETKAKEVKQAERSEQVEEAEQVKEVKNIKPEINHEAVKPEVKTEAPKPEILNENNDDENKNETENINNNLAEHGAEFVNDVFKLMGFNAEAKIIDKNLIEIIGEDCSDYVIGHYADALRSMEYLLNLSLRDPKNEPRIKLDSCGYRDRRTKSLQRLAEATARQAIKYGRPIRLDPMASWERWVIHTTLKERDDVMTESVGEAPFRKVVVMPKISHENHRSYNKRNYSGRYAK